MTERKKTDLEETLTKVEMPIELRDEMKRVAEEHGITFRRAVQEAGQLWIAHKASSEIDRAMGLNVGIGADGKVIPRPELEDHPDFCAICQAITSKTKEHAEWEEVTNPAGKTIRQIKGFKLCPAYAS